MIADHAGWVAAQWLTQALPDANRATPRGPLAKAPSLALRDDVGLNLHARRAR